MLSHGHGHGRADINFVIPELLERIEHKTGTYFADEGNFSAAGAFDMRYCRALDQSLLALSGGDDGFARTVLATSFDWNGHDVLVGTEHGRTDGPWLLAQRLRRTTALVKVTQGRQTAGYAVSLAGCDGERTATDQVPERANALGHSARGRDFTHWQPLPGRTASATPAKASSRGRFAGRSRGLR